MHPQSWPSSDTAKQFCRCSILGDCKIESPIAIIIGHCRSTAFSVHQKAAGLPRDGHKTARAITFKQKSTPRIEPWHGRLGLEEILAQKNVILRVAVEIGHAHPERRSELRLCRKHPRQEFVAAIQED